MKTTEKVVCAVFGAAILFATHQLVGILFDAHNWKGLGTAEWASWVQAIGSIAAIYGAFSISNKQHKKDLRLQEKQVWLQEQNRFKIVKAMLDRIRTRFDGLVVARENSDFYIARQDHIDNLRDVVTLLEQLPPFEMPDPELLVLCLSIQYRARVLCDDLQAETDSMMNVRRGQSRPPGPERAIEEFDLHLTRAISLCISGAAARKALIEAD